MSNRFNTLRNDEYVSSNTYVPMPLGQIAGMAKDYSDTYKANIKELDETNDLYSKVNAIDKHQGYKKALVDEFTKKTEELAERFASGQDTFKAERDLHKLKRDWLNNPVRQELENSYLNYGAYQKDKITKGAKYGEWYDNYISFKGKRDDGSIEGYRYTGMGERQNHQKLAQDMMDKIIPDKSAWDNINFDKDGNVIDKKGSNEYITEKRIQTLAASKVPSFLTTTEGEDFARMINYRDPNANIEQAALEYLTAAGMNSVHSKLDIDNSFAYAPKYKFDQKQANLTTSTNSEGINTNIGDSNPIIKDMKFNSKGNLEVPEKNIVTGYKTNAGGHQTPIYQVGGQDLDKMAEQVRVVQDIQRNHPDLKGLTPKATMDAYNAAYKSMSNEQIPLESISNVAAQNISDAIVRNKSQRNFYVYDAKGKTEAGTLETVLDELGITEQEFDKQLAGNPKEGVRSAIGGYTQAGPVAGAYYAEIKNSDGESRRVMISPDNEMKKTFSTSQAVNEARKTMKESTVTPIESNPNYKILVKPSISKDGKATWKYVELITDEKGNPIKSRSTNLDEIRKIERDYLTSSGYLGSQVGVLKDNTTE